MLSSLSSLCTVLGRAAARRPAPVRRARKARLELETLEDRTVPTIVFTPKFGADTISGSPSDGMHSPPVNLIFAGSYWTTPQGQQDASATVNAAKSLLSGPYLSGLTQYGSDGKATFGQSWTDAAFTSTPDNATFNSDLQQYLQGTITSHNVLPGAHTAQTAPIYVVIVDPHQSGGNTAVGWNVWGTYYQWMGDIKMPVNMHMIWVWPGLQSGKVWMDYNTTTLSHELAETMSDPDPNGITVQVPNAVPGGGYQGQIADGEAEMSAYGYSYRLGGVLVQAYWSAKDQAFIVPDVTYGSSGAQSFFADPVWDGSTFMGTYNLRIVGDQLGTNYADNIAVAGTANTSVVMNNESAVFDAGTVNSINVDTKGGSNNVQVSGLLSGVTLNLDSSGWLSNDAIVIGANGSLAGIQGTVNIANTSGQSSVVIDDVNDGARAITVTDHSIAYSGLATINYKAAYQQNGYTHGISALRIEDANAANQIDALSVGALTETTLDWYPQDNLFGPAKNKIQLM